MNALAVEVRELAGPAEMRAGVALYREVFQLASDDPAVSPRLLTALQHNGGAVLGAFAGDELVGFVYGFLGLDRQGELYHYSQMAVVATNQQGRGVGKALKLGQRDFVLTQGVMRMRWAFDPLRVRNAYFNLDVLGARARWFTPDMYSVEDTGRDAGRPSHRLVADWDLAASRAGDVPVSHPEPPAQLPPARATPQGWDTLLAVPAHHEPAELAGHTESVAAELGRLTAAGLAAVSCRRSADGSYVYRLREDR